MKRLIIILIGLNGKMKKFIGFMLSLLFLSCNSNMPDNKADNNSIVNDSIEVCGCTNPTKDLPWLKELIQKADTDKTCNYTGCIWHKKTSKGKDIFVTNMMLGSGGIMYWVFDCKGNHLSYPGVEICVACEYVGHKHFYLDNDSLPLLHKLKSDILIYINMECPCDEYENF